MARRAQLTAMHASALVTADSLRRDYGARSAVRDLSFGVSRGEVLGLLGPNGAGKSTTLQMLGGCLLPSSGRVTVAGHDMVQQPRRAKAALGYLPERPPLYLDQTVDEYLDYAGRLHGLGGKRLRAARERIKARCGLIADGERLISTLSQGYRQRVGIAQALLHDPAVVILDEPTVGLDPNQIRDIRALIVELGRDHAVILSTHLLSEVESICDRVLILHRGRPVYQGDVAPRDADTAATALCCRFRNAPSEAALTALPGIEAIERLADGRLRLSHAAGEAPVDALVAATVAGGWGLLEMTVERPTLEQLFVEITCREEFS